MDHNNRAYFAEQSKKETLVLNSVRRNNNLPAHLSRWAGNYLSKSLNHSPCITIHHLTVTLSRGWAKAPACRLQVSLCPFSMYTVRLCTTWLVSLVVFSCRVSPSGDPRCPSVDAVDGPAHAQSILFTLLNMSNIGDISIFVCATARLFCACLVSVHSL